MDIDFSSTDWAELPASERKHVRTKLASVEDIIACGYGRKGELVQAIARQQRVAPSTVNRWVMNFRRHGVRGLIDTRIACRPLGSL